MPFLFFVPLIFIWIVTYWVAKYPAQAVGRLIARRSPNTLFDIAVCAVLTVLFLCVVFAIVVLAKDYLAHEPYPYTMYDRATIVAVIFAPPVFLALAKGARRSRKDSQRR
jgi:hypothetical protein